MRPLTLLFFLIISTCSAHVVSPHHRHVLASHDTDTVTSTDLTTDVETIHDTTTLSTTSLHSVSNTDRSTITSTTSESHTKVITSHSTPTTVVTENTVSTETIEQTYKTLTEKETVTELAPTTVTAQPPRTKTEVEEIAAPQYTCCDYSDVAAPYPKKDLPTTPVDLRCLHPVFREGFRRHVPANLDNRSFCSLSTSSLHKFFQEKVFNKACYHGENSGEENHKDLDDIKAENDMHVKCFSGFMESLCGFHIITNTGHEIDDICGKSW